MQTKKFIRKKEDFTCQHCGYKVKGSGYTNHCPVCLWSKHVDIYPGDRNADCGGLMEPVDVSATSKGYRIVHMCTTCKHSKSNKAATEDNFEQLLALSAQKANN